MYEIINLCEASRMFHSTIHFRRPATGLEAFDSASLRRAARARDAGYVLGVITCLHQRCTLQLLPWLVFAGFSLLQ
jgi:hypothetical protein